MPPACGDEPPYDPDVLTSTATALSHRAGEACLAGCHEEGGTAKLVFEAAGTVFRAEGLHVVAEAGGVVRGVGGTALTVDACGNFYAAPGALVTSPRKTQPWVQNPVFRRMEKPLAKEPKAGDCSQSGCHDFSGPLNAGVYY